MPRLYCALLLLLLAVSVAPARAALRGQPLVQRYPATSLPVDPSYGAIAVDAQGTLYAGGDKGLMAFRSGAWETVAMPVSPAWINELRLASDGQLYVGGRNVLGRMRTAADGSLHFVDLRAKFAGSKAPESFAIQSITQNTRGVYFVSDKGLYLLGRDGIAHYWPNTNEKMSSFAFGVGADLYRRVLGKGLYRFDDGVLVPIPGGDVFAQRLVVMMWPSRDGALVVGSDGFYALDAAGAHKLPGDGEAEFTAHPPYNGNARLSDGSLVIGTLDGVLLHFSPDLRLLDRVEPRAGAVIRLALDREGAIWIASEQEIERVALPSPWSAYALHGTNGDGILDSAWYDGSLWLGSTSDLLRGDPVRPGVAPAFTPRHWSKELEVFALQATDAGLLVGMHGLAVLDPGADALRELLPFGDRNMIQRLLGSSFDPHRVYAIGIEQIIVLAQRGGRWQVASQTDLHGVQPNGIVETAVGELWMGDMAGGVERWRFDAAGQRVDRHRFSAGEGLRIDPAVGTHVFALDGRLYAIAGDAVQRFDGGRFVDARLPDMPGLTQPGELESIDTPLGTFAWTSRQIWRRRPHENEFRPLLPGAGTATGLHSLRLEADGQLRVATSSGLLQFDPSIDVPSPALHARLDRVELRAPGRAPELLPLARPPQLPPGSGLALRFGMDTMEPGAEYRFRMRGYSDDWSDWSDDRVLDYRRLPPGDLTLELQGRMHDGRPAQMLRLPLSVAPFWYERMWVRVLLALSGLLLIMALAYAIARWRYRQVIARNRELEQKVSERTDELEQANRRLADLATRDGLTGIANRRSLEQTLAQEWQRCAALGQPLAAVMLDVDHFKQFNDRHGHQAGDDQLRRVARAVAEEAISSHELAARYGGEEFSLVLPGLSADAAAVRAESLRRRVERMTAESGMPGTASLGVAALVPDPATSPSDLLRGADAALYRAKHGGRNRVEIASGGDVAMAQAR